MRIAIFFLIIAGIPALTLAYWWWADRRLRPLPGARWYRLALAVFSLATVIAFGSIVGTRIYSSLTGNYTEFALPKAWQALVMMWGLIILPFIAVPLMGAVGLKNLGVWITRRFKPKSEHDAVATEDAREPATDDATKTVSRRDLLRATLAGAPAVATLGATLYSIPQLNRFRIREITLNLPSLPQALDGLTIAQLSDTHVGRLTNGSVLADIAKATNDLQADLVVSTGDLINHNPKDLPTAIRMLDQLDRRSGLAIIEGNHDLFMDRALGQGSFHRGMRDAHMPLLVDETQTFIVRGQKVQILGARWSNDRWDRPIANLLEQRDPDAFPILLDHHPHAFDAAADAGLPLTLAGHTHGGQLHLTHEFGPGPLMYKYWSGHYTQNNAHLVVSNGTGNWFPLRTNAPAEIIHLTLRSA
ncbi:MAG: metallophosphoesterase [Planctomycetota bacterium]